MPKQLNVSLQMTADTSQAKKQLQDLQNQLSNLAKTGSSSSGSLGLTKEIQNATAQAAQLKTQLQAATDVNTGKLDLTKFTQQMRQSGTSLEQYRKSLAALGPEGNKAFAQLALSISNADAKIGNANSKLKQFGTTLANAARWQISSSVLHGFMSSIQSAMGYAKDLNESLSNIRIVTGQSADQMAEFAVKANKAAQALSTTTTAYTDAALIFAQQGLGTADIEARTNAVIKMAQVTGDSASEVSSYMTAIWNNFADGSQSLEYYEDVIAKLGATTAASSAEISEGISKFASVAQTAGLSYEYATSALATVVAATRQSADTVGTAFKTLFARIQDLELGKTLDDGTTLGQYSEALNKIGVSIKDTSGKMRSMDDILDDMGEKWKTLGQDTQTAVAQAVAGTRQYTQLVALMENWDTMKTNVASASGAEGTVDEQVGIHAESWEAARKRVRAAAEEIYSALIDEDFFIKMDDMFAKMLNSVSVLIKGMGGIPGILTTALAMWTTFSNQLGAGIDNIVSKIYYSTKVGKNKVESQRDTAINEAIKGQENTDSGKAMKQILESTNKLKANADKINETEAKTYALRMDNLKAKQKEIALDEQRLKQADRDLALANAKIKSITKNAEKDKANAKARQLGYANENERKADEKNKEARDKVDNAIRDRTAGIINKKEAKTVLIEYLNNNGFSVSQRNGYDDLKKQYESIQRPVDTNDIYSSIQDWSASGRSAAEEDNLKNKIKQYFDQIGEELNATDINDILKRYKEVIDKQKEDIENADKKINYEKNFTNKSKEYSIATKMSEELSNTNNTTSKTEIATKVIEKLREKYSDLANDMPELNDAFDQFSTALEAAKDDVVAQETAVDNLHKALNNLSEEAIGDAYDMQSNYTNSIDDKDDRKNIEQRDESINNRVNEEVNQLFDSISFEEQANAFNESLDKLKKNSLSLGESVQTVVRGFSSFAMAIQQIKNLGSIWNDDDISFGDKLLTTLTSLGMIIPMVTTAITALADAKLYDVAASTKEYISDLKQLSTKGLLAAALAKETNLKFLQNMARKLNISTMKTENNVTRDLTVKELQEAIASKIAAAGTNKLTISMILAKIAVEKLASAFMKLFPVIAAIVAGLAAFAAFSLILNAINPDKIGEASDKYKAVSQAAEDAKNRVSELNNEISNISSAIDSYDTAIDKLHACAKGTDEWKEALQDVQNQTNKLIEEYPELLSMEGSFNSDGTINTKVLKELKDKKEKDLTVAQNTVISTEAEKKSAQARLNAEQASNDNREMMSNTTVAGVAGGITALTTLIGTIIAPGVGTAVGVAVGASISGIMAGVNDVLESAFTIDNDKLEDVTNTVSQLKQDGTVITRELVAEIGGLDLKKDSAAIDKIINAANSLSEAAIAQKQAANLIINNWKNDNGKESSEQIDAIVSKKFINEKNKLVNDYKNHDNDGTKSKLLEAYGLTGEVNISSLNYDKTKEGYTYTDDDGNEQTLYLEHLAQYELSDKIGEFYKEIENAVTKIQQGNVEQKRNTTKSGTYTGSDYSNNDNLKNSSNAIIDAAGGTLSKTSWNDINELSKYLSQDSSNFNNEYLYDLFGLTGDNRTGEKVKEELLKVYNTAVEEYNQLLIDAKERGGGISDALIGVDYKQKEKGNNLSNSAMKAITSSLSEAFKVGGYEGVNELKDVFSKLNNEEDILNLSNILSNIDWSKPSEVQKINELLEENGIALDESSEEWQKYITYMQYSSTSITSLISNFNSLRESIASVDSVLSKVSFGSIISDENYEKLIAINSEFANLFTMSADGRKFIGTQQDIKSMKEAAGGDLSKFYHGYQLAEATGTQTGALSIGEDKTFIDYAKGNAVLQEEEQKKLLRGLQLDLDDGLRDQLAAEAGYSYDQLMENLDDDKIRQAWLSAMKKMSIAADNGDYSQSTAQEVYVNSYIDSINELKKALSKGVISQETYDKMFDSVAIGAIQASTSVKELKEAVLSYDSGDELTQYQLYSDQLIKLAESYDTCKEELEAYQTALAHGVGDDVEKAQSDLENALAIAEGAKKHGLQADEVELQAEILQRNANLSEDSAARVAIANQRMNKSVQDLGSNWEAWSNSLRTAKKGSMEYAVALDNAIDSLVELTGAVDGASIPINFFDNTTEEGTRHLELMGQAALGDVDAINELGVAVARAEFDAMSFSDVKVDDNDKFRIAKEEFNTYKDTILDGIDNLQSKLDTLHPGDNVEEILGENWVSALNAMAEATQMSVEDMNSYLNELGIDANVETAEVDLPQTIYGYKGTWDQSNTTFDLEPYPIETKGKTTVATINGDIKYTGTSGGTVTGGVSKTTSSKPKKADKSQMKDNKDIERYHEINQTLSTIDRQLTKINNTESRAFGKDKIAAIREQAAALEQQAEAYMELNREANAYLEQDRNAVIGIGAQIDEFGTISNYTSLMEQFNDQYNQGYLAYINASNAATTDAAKEAAEEAWKSVQEDYNNKVKLIQNYENSLAQEQESAEKARQAFADAYDKKLSEIQVSVELNINISDRKLKMLQSVFDDMGDDVDKTVDKMANLGKQIEENFGKVTTKQNSITSILNNTLNKTNGMSEEQIKKAGLENVPKLSEEAKQGIIERFKNGSMTDDDLNILSQFKITDAEMSELMSASEELLSLNSEIKSKREELLARTISTYEKMNEEIDRNAKHLQSLANQTKAYQNIIDTVGRKIVDPDGSATRAIAAANSQNAQSKASIAKTKVDAIDSAIAMQEAAIAEAHRNGSGESTIKKLQEDLKKMQEDRDAAQEDWLSSWEEAFEEIGNKFDTNLTLIVDEFGEAVAGAAGSIANLQESYNMQANIAADYLQDYEKIYNLSKLNRDITQSMNDSSNVKNNQRLAALQKEINETLQSDAKISEYTAENYRRQYELLLAQDQLEQARNNKSTLKLKRDSQGNYSYQYGTDEDNIAAAQQNYEDKLYALQKANYEYQNKMQEAMINIDAWYTEYVASLDKTDEHYQEKLDAATKYYNTQMTYYSGELGLVLNNNKKLYDNEWTAYSAMTGYKKSADDQYVDSWGETILKQKSGFDTLKDYQDTHVTEAGKMVTAIKGQYSDYQTAIQTTFSMAGTSVAGFASLVKQTVSDMASENTRLAENTKKIAETYLDTFSKALDYAVDFCGRYDSQISSIIDTNSDLYNSITSLLEAYASLAAASDISKKITINYEINGNSNPDYNLDTGSAPTDNKESIPNESNKEEIKDYELYSRDSGKLLKRYNTKEEAIGAMAKTYTDSSLYHTGFILKNAKKNHTMIIPYTTEGTYSADFLTTLLPEGVKTLSAFDTGGYTGNWNSSDGKLAMLHQKELVLNANDTDNMLNIIDSVRSITDSFQAKAANSLAQMIAESIAAALGNTTNINHGDTAQNITINADFPAASSAYEIETALNSLVGRATQRAGISKNYR